MKVLDLQCTHEHVFEGWFASEDDFLSQCERGLVECPVCADASITKKPSAPRLNLGATRSESAGDTQAVATGAEPTLQNAWMTLARRIMANTEDVGESFAEEARRMHYGETPERGIRGKASRAETDSLLEEGIPVLSLPLPEALKGPVQ